MSQTKIISGRPDPSGPIMVAPYRARNALAQPICEACGSAMRAAGIEPSSTPGSPNEEHSYVCPCGCRLTGTVEWKQ